VESQQIGAVHGGNSKISVQMVFCATYTTRIPFYCNNFFAMAIFRCNKMRYYHKIPLCVNRLHILPQFYFVTLSIPFVAIEATYCHKLHQRCNMIAILRQLCHVAWISHFVAIQTVYCNKVFLCGKFIHIVQQFWHVVVFIGIVAKMASYCDKICIGCNRSTFFLTFCVLQ
jgi:hypothetical protein